MRCSSFLRGAIAALVLGAAPLQAQSPAVPVALYGDAVRHYSATGDAAAAVAPLKDWTRPQLERAIDAYLVVAQGNVLAPAAVLQLEIALGVVGQAPVVAFSSLWRATTLAENQESGPSALEIENSTVGFDSPDSIAAAIARSTLAPPFPNASSARMPIHMSD